jgi:hypothetical protein
VRRFWLVLAASIAALALPAAAAAHGRGPAVAVDDRVAVDASVRGVEARVLDGDRSLRVTVAPGLTLVVLGSLDESLLRFGADGVWANRASPTAAADRVVASGAGWARVAGGGSFAWHDHRLAPPPGARRAAGRWSVPVLVDGRHAVIGGTFRRVRRPSLLLWLAVVAAAGTAIAALARLLPRRRAAVAVVLGVVAAVAAGAAVAVFAVRDAPTGGVRVAQLAVAAALVAAAAAVVTRGVWRRPGVAGVVGALATAATVSLLPIFRHGVVVAAVAPTMARVLCATALVAGSAAAVMALFADDDGGHAR